MVGSWAAGGVRAALADVSLLTLPADISAAALPALVTRANAESVDAATIVNRELRRQGKLGAPQREDSKFKEVILAMLNYENARTVFPISSSLLSWRVYILPYMEQQNLYRKFHLNEPWDSPNNIALLDEMPDVFRTIGDPWDSGITRVEEFTGPGTPNQVALGPSKFTDGISNTILLAEAGSGNGVPWTKPTDVPYHPNNPFSALGDIGPNFVTTFADGRTLTRAATLSISLLDAYITYNGGESVTNPPPVTTVQGVYVHQTDGDTTTNEFGADAFDVVLDKDPAGTMVVNLSISDPAVATLNKLSLTFTSANWNKPQRVILRGVDNHVINADQIVSVTVGGQSFNATIRDDDAQPALVGDYNHNGVVDAADYTVWRDTLGSNVAAYSGADGSGNALVDSFDYDAWKTHFGSALPAAGAASAALAIGEVAEPVDSADARVSPLSSGNVRSALIADTVPKQLSEESWAGGPVEVAGSAAANSRDSRC